MEKEKKVRVGVIGLGKMGILHTALVNMIPQAQLVALSDINKSLSKYVKDSGLKAPFFVDLRQMLREVNMDAVFISTPTFANLPCVEPCLEKNLDIFLEKPLAPTLEAARKMVSLVSQRTIVHATGYLFAHIALFQEAKKLLEERLLGRLFRFRSSIYTSEVFSPKKGWTYDKTKSGGGAVINIASHLLYLLFWYFGPVKEVYAKTQSLYSAVDDAATAFLEFANGVSGTLDVSWSIPGYRLSYIDLVIEGDNGTLELTNDYIKIYLYRAHHKYPKEWTTIHRIDLACNKFELGGEGYYEEDLEFIHCCLERKKPTVSWEEGLEVQKIVEAIYRSAEEKKSVRIGEND